MLAALFGLCGPAFAQVNTEKLRSWEEPGLGGSVDLSVTYRSGNVDLLQLGASARAQWARLEVQTGTTTSGRLLDLVYFIGDVNLGIRSSERFKNAGFGHLRWTRMWRPWLGSEVFAQAQYNEFIRLQQRYLGGVGARFEVVRSKYIEVVLGTGYMLEFEQNDVPEDGPDAPEVLAHRSTSYLSIKAYADDPEISFVGTVYMQPRLTELSDYRVLGENELSVAVTTALRLVVGVYLRYDSQPVAEVETLDLSYLNKLRFVF